MKRLSFRIGLLTLVAMGLLVAISGCTPSPTMEPIGPVTKLPQEMVLKITDLKGDSWTLLESVPVSEYGAEYVYQIAFSREITNGSSNKEMVTCKVALYYHEGEAHERFFSEIKNEAPASGLSIGDEAFLESNTSINGKSITFRKANVVVWIWMNHEGDIESLAEIVEERIAKSD